jgi:hypothetical protein
MSESLSLLKDFIYMKNLLITHCRFHPISQQGAIEVPETDYFSDDIKVEHWAVAHGGRQR